MARICFVNIFWRPCDLTPPSGFVDECEETSTHEGFCTCSKGQFEVFSCLGYHIELGFLWHVDNTGLAGSKGASLMHVVNCI